ncbi:MAG: maleylacetoacetate isomerase, partial [Shewanella sp.]
HQAAYSALNPQELVPTLLLMDGAEETALSQSLAIIEYLDERYPTPALLPQAALARAQVRAMALSIACDIHPLNNLRVLQYLTNTLGVDEQAKNAWYHHWITTGFAPLETELLRHSGRYCFGDTVTLADVCLVPQVYNAQRFKVDLTPYPNIMRVWQACEALPAFALAAPERQADAQ